MTINWHSPDDERSSQVICISALCSLRDLPDRDEVLAALFERVLHGRGTGGPWTLRPEHSWPTLLGETGAGTPTHVDVFCESPSAVVCVEGKFLFDARDGFGGCGQVAKGHCAGYHGSGSDRKTETSAWCRLEVRDGRRAPRRYWDVGRSYFLDSVFREQSIGEVCPFAGPSFQLMRNVLFAASAAGPGRAFGVLCLVPDAEGARVRAQIERFRSTVLRPEHSDSVAVRTYEELAELLAGSDHAPTRELARFLSERLHTLLTLQS